MTIRTVTYDDAVHKFVPLEPTEEILRSMIAVNIFFETQDSMTDAFMSSTYYSAITAAPPFTSLPNHDLDLIEEALKSVEINLDVDEFPEIPNAIAALKRIKGE